MSELEVKKAETDVNRSREELRQAFDHLKSQVADRSTRARHVADQVTHPRATINHFLSDKYKIASRYVGRQSRALSQFTGRRYSVANQYVNTQARRLQENPRPVLVGLAGVCGAIALYFGGRALWGYYRSRSTGQSLKDQGIGQSADRGFERDNPRYITVEVEEAENFI